MLMGYSGSYGESRPALAGSYGFDAVVTSLWTTGGYFNASGLELPPSCDPWIDTLDPITAAVLSVSATRIGAEPVVGRLDTVFLMRFTSRGKICLSVSFRCANN